MRSFYLHQFNYSVFSISDFVPWRENKGGGVSNSEKIFKKKSEWEGCSEKLTDDHELYTGGKEESNTTVGSLFFVITVKSVLVTL
jgi:hypothetical protein